MWGEPVRGALPDPSFCALPGIERARALQRGLVPRSPLSHLVGYRVTQVGSGSATLTMPATPWLQHGDGTVDLKILAEEALVTATLTAAPAGSEVSTATLTVKYLRPSLVDSEGFVARARVVHTGTTFTLAEVLLEDVSGRQVAHTAGSFLIRPVEYPPAAPLLPGRPVEEPSYTTPDPHARPLGEHFPFAICNELDGLAVLHLIQSGEPPPVPLYALLGMELAEVEPGSVVWTLRASEWFCSRRREVAPGVVATIAHAGLAASAWTYCPATSRLGLLDQSISLLRAVPPDGGELVSRGRLLHTDGGFLVSTAEVTDGTGNRVALGQQTSVLVEARRGEGGAPERVLATVVFTDIVGSTRRAEELGDERWREVLAEHDRAVRRQLEIFKGREVKSTGDGFLATFDSPARAVQCARSVRDAVRRIGLEVRIGVHTGECEIVGTDVAGIAVHVAARVQAAAAPGEILVSGTVPGLVAGSGLRFIDRGRHHLRGIEGEWQLLAVED